MHSMMQLQGVSTHRIDLPIDLNRAKAQIRRRHMRAKSRNAQKGEGSPAVEAETPSPAEVASPVKVEAHSSELNTAVTPVPGDLTKKLFPGGL